MELSSEGLAQGAAGGLHRFDETSELVETRFVHPAAGGGSLACSKGCHTSGGFGDFADVPSEERATLRTHRRGAALSLVQRWVAQQP